MPYLCKQHKSVVCIDNLHLGSRESIADLMQHDQFSFHEMDVNDTKSLHALFTQYQFKTVYHLAANSDISAGSLNVDIDLSLTFNTTLSLLQVMKQHQTPEIIFASSSAVYGPASTPTSESYGPLLPSSFYGAAKLSSESFISAYCEQYPLKSWVIRFPNVIGPNLAHGLIYDFIQNYLTHQLHCKY